MGARTPSLTGSATEAGRRPLGHKSPFTPSHLPLLSGLTNLRPRGGMVDTGDLKSLGRIGRAGSSPAEGTKEKAGRWACFFVSCERLISPACLRTSLAIHPARHR